MRNPYAKALHAKPQQVVQDKFGSGSLRLDGTTDDIKYADHADWTLGTGDFTIEAWGYQDGRKKTLREIYDATLREEIPDDLKRLLDDLD